MEIDDAEPSKHDRIVRSAKRERRLGIVVFGRPAQHQVAGTPPPSASQRRAQEHAPPERWAVEPEPRRLAAAAKSLQAAALEPQRQAVGPVQLQQAAAPDLKLVVEPPQERAASARRTAKCCEPSERREARAAPKTEAAVPLGAG